MTCDEQRKATEDNEGEIGALREKLKALRDQAAQEHYLLEAIRLIAPNVFRDDTGAMIERVAARLRASEG